MRKIDGKVAREQPSQQLIGGDERPQPLVNLAVQALATLLDRDHGEQANTDANEIAQKDFGGIVRGGHLVPEGTLPSPACSAVPMPSGYAR